MHFNTSKGKFLDAVQIAERVVGKKESLPVLSCVLLDVGKELSVRATNLESGIEIRILGEVIEKGTVAVPVAVLSQTLRSTGSDKVTLKTDSNNLILETRGTKTVIKAVPHTEFPQITTQVGKRKLQLERTPFLKALQSVSYAASSSMIRPELGSVSVALNAKKLIAAATDSFRLAEKTVMNAGPDGESEILVPLKHVLELTHILERIADEKITVSAEDAQMTVLADNMEFISRVVDATFPNYKEIIPKTFTTEATLLKNDLTEVLRKARVFSGTEQRVGLHVYPKKKVFDLTAQSQAIGEMSDSIDAAVSGEDIDINFHIGYIADCLPIIESDSVTLGFSGAGKPLVIRGVSDQSFLYLVMPLNR